MASPALVVPYDALLPLAAVAGFVGAMSGMGGGVVLIPALTYAGLDIKHAIAVSAVSVIATSSGAASAYLRDRLTNVKIGMFLEMFTIAGALAGASITLAANARPLFVAFGLVLLTSWGAVWAHRHETWGTAGEQDAFSRWLELDGAYSGPDRDGPRDAHVRVVPLTQGAARLSCRNTRSRS